MYIMKNKDAFYLDEHLDNARTPEKIRHFKLIQMMNEGKIYSFDEVIENKLNKLRIKKNRRFANKLFLKYLLTLKFKRLWQTVKFRKLFIKN
jgi:hypothetical protein